MLGNQVDENTLVLQILSGLPAEYDMIKTVLENMDGKRNLAVVSAKLLTVEQRGDMVRRPRRLASSRKRFRQRLRGSRGTSARLCATTATRRGT